MKIRIICNNSGCSKKVKSFKFKIHRTYRGYAENKKHVSQGESYISTLKEPGCNAKEKIDREYFVTLP